jgi:hypothetical protein
MTIEEVKQKIQEGRQKGREQEGLVCGFSENGPASINLVEALLAVVQEQEERIKRLELSRS